MRTVCCFILNEKKTFIVLFSANYTCLPNQFKCEKDNKCIPDYKKCDNKSHCSDNSDEIGCGKFFWFFFFFDAFNNLSVILRQCLDVAGSSVLTFRVLLH